jgi:hypothetical protein
MGMYTELVLKCRVRDTTPDGIKEVLRHMFGNNVEPETLPEHPFFKSPRWSLLGKCSSYYHHPEALSGIFESSNDWGDMYIFSRSDLKNYDNEIALFVDWITPYVDGYGKACIGWEWYEEDEAPTLIFVEVKYNENI